MNMQNGIARGKTLTVNLKTTDEISFPGYPKAYNITDSFTTGGTTYAAITDQQLQELTETEYTERLVAFNSFVVTENPGFSFNGYVFAPGTEPWFENTTLCPIQEA